VEKNSKRTKKNQANEGRIHPELVPTVNQDGNSIGIDLGDRRSNYCVLDRPGEIIAEGSVATRREEFIANFSGLAKARIALEVGTHSAWVSELLSECGHEVIVAHPRALFLIRLDTIKPGAYSKPRLLGISNEKGSTPRYA